MIIDIQKIPVKGLRIIEDFNFASKELVEEDAVFLEPVHAEIEIKKIQSKIKIKGKISTKLNLTCGRCLSPYLYKVDSSFDLVFLPIENFELKEELETEDLEKLFYSNEEIDLSEIVLEQLNLSFPLKPLCSDECAGLCPVCGQRLKDKKCNCEIDKVDPRLKQLSLFKRG
ncbi:DUF177 domain-containing protein [SCandidatus Aminicenantes bacterium Aminicenantia_JdfR_composite]|jgi:uncharacterized protein|nr:DUF177 domain-containing protein [SCandidatus Aminicenantes bacterium Aminicenantia_JdfR_composite]MCP2598121.1 DUF177 domain-containing protein [Candidatus Aminicenantes bacterium AC-335-L06]